MGARRRDTVFFLSDYGLEDEFVGVVAAVVRRMAPHVQLVDLVHRIAPHDVGAGARALARAAPYLGSGVVLAVVDPGVATGRRPVAVAAGDLLLVGPDNGLLCPAIEVMGGAASAVALSDARYHLPPVPGAGRTFDGRDVFAPVASHLCLGTELGDLGTVIDPATLFQAPSPVLERLADGRLAVEVTWIDRFGNAQLSAGPGDVAGTEPVAVELPGRSLSVSRVNAFDDLEPGEPGLVADASGRLALVLRRSSAAVELHLAPGMILHILPGG